MHKTRRKWYPNAQSKSLYSDTLGSMVKVNLTSRVLKSIDKMGGFDHYIQNTSARHLGDEGIKWRIILEQHIENGRKPIHPSRTADDAAASLSETDSSDAPVFYSSDVSGEDSAASQLPPTPQLKQTPPKPSEHVSSSGLLFSQEARKRPPTTVARIPVFSRALQRVFVKQNVQKSILSARGTIKASSRRESIAASS